MSQQGKDHEDGSSGNGGGSGANAPETLDLDQFLSPSPAETAEKPAQGLSGDSIAMPDTDRVVVIGIFVDDSGSMDPLCNSVIEGLNLSVAAFKGAKGSDFFLDVRGFLQVYFSGMLKDVSPESFAGYDPAGGTPLFTHALSQLEFLRSKTKQFHDLGIPATLAMLVMTDGEPNSESLSAGDFQSRVEPGDYIVGMGITNTEYGVGTYKNLFRNMGITKVFTSKAKPEDVRHAINQFSQSVAAIGV